MLGQELSDLGTATTIQSYDLSQYESLTFTISSYQNANKIVLGIKNEAGEWIEQRTPEATGDLVIDLSNLNGKGKICIEVYHSSIYMSKIYLK